MSLSQQSKSGKNPIIEQVESSYLKPNPPLFNVGDVVNVDTLIREGDKDRIQVFKGTVIAKNGHGLSASFTVLRTINGFSMERVFLVHSPRIGKVEVVRPGKTRRAKLYYLRGRTGKSAKIREQFNVAKTAAGAAAKTKA